MAWLKGRSGFWKQKFFLLAGITLLAAFFRLYKIDSLPPGDGHDPAYYGVDALTVLEGEWPIFFPGLFGGREPLFSYLVAACALVWGIGPLSIHMASAIVGILTIPAVFLVANEIFSSEKGLLAQFGGLLAALAVAISYWHLNWCRYALRAILVPLLVSLTLCSLVRGVRKNSRWSLIGCGVFLGLSMYTYQAARLLPLLVLGFSCVIWVRKSFSRKDLVNLILIFGVALVVFAPLGSYFLTNPGSFTRRIEQTLAIDTSQSPSSNLGILVDNLVKTFLVFNVHGEDWPVVNLPGRPVLDIFLSVALWLGIGISLLRIKRPSYLFLLTWLIVMIIPAILAEEAAVAKRALGTMPAVAMLIAIGTLAPCENLQRWSDRYPSLAPKVLSASLSALVAVGFFYSGLLTYHDYFLVWAQDPDLFIHFDVGIDAIGEYIGKLPDDEEVYLSPIPPEHPSVILNSKQRPGIKGYNGRVCLVLPERAMRNTTYVIVPKDDKNSLDLLPGYFPSGRVVEEGPLYYQQPFFVAYRVPVESVARIIPDYQMEINWDNKIQLLGYDLDVSAYKPGEAVHLTLYYQGLNDMEENYTTFAHLLGSYNPATGGPLWSQDDSEPCRRGYPTPIWEVGEIIVDTFTLLIPADAPAGDYQLAMGFYTWPTIERLPILDVSGQIVADSTVLGQVRIEGE